MTWLMRFFIVFQLFISLCLVNSAILINGAGCLIMHPIRNGELSFFSTEHQSFGVEMRLVIKV